MDVVFVKNDNFDVIVVDKVYVWYYLIQYKVFEMVDLWIIVEGKGMCVWDVVGKEYFDGVFGGVWMVNVGYGCQSIVDVVCDQLVLMNFFVNMFGLVFGVLFVECLILKMLGMSWVFYLNFGFEVNEKVFKMVCQIFQQYYGGKKFKIFYCDWDYYGMMIMVLFVGGQGECFVYYGLFMLGFVVVLYCLEYCN